MFTWRFMGSCKWGDEKGKVRVLGVKGSGFRISGF